MNKIELHLLYKNETSESHEDMEVQAYMTKKSFDIILDSDEIDQRIVDMMPHNNTGQNTTLTFADPEYVKWMENKLLELIGKDESDKLEMEEKIHDLKTEIAELEIIVQEANDAAESWREAAKDNERNGRHYNEEYSV